MISQIVYNSVLMLLVAHSIGAHQMKVAYNKDGICTVDGQQPMDTKYSKVDFTSFKCLSDFHKFVSMPQCGDPWYDLKKYCAQVDFFKNQEIDKSYIVMNQEDHDMMLVLVSGCFICNGKLNTVKLSLSYHLPSGTFFTDCWETRRQLKPIEYKRNKKHSTGLPSAGFTLPGVFWHRLCKGLIWDDEKPHKYEQIKLHVEHDCAGGTKSFDVPLADIPWRDSKDHIAEVFGLELDLQKGTAKYVAVDKDQKVKTGWQLA